MAFAAVLISVLVFLLPSDALAWGPATHLEIGWKILHNLSLVAAPARTLIERFPYDFLYGNMSADIVVGKNLVEELKHCHNWRVGFRVLKNAGSDSQKAFAYGYLSHLAADTVAHNRFIPEMMVRSFQTRTLRHIYWELRFDALADKRVWRTPRKLVRAAHRDNDRLLNSVLEDTPLSFRTNKTIFSSIMSLHRVEQWHRAIDLLSGASRWALGRHDKERWSDMSTGAVHDFLGHFHSARCIGLDPSGKKSIAHAMDVRKRLKRMRKDGRDWQDALARALDDLNAPRT